MRFLVSETSRSATPVAEEKEEVAKISDSRESPVGRYVIRYLKASVAIMSKWQMKSLPADRISDLDDEEFLAEAWQHMLDERPLGTSSRAMQRFKARLRFRKMLETAGGVFRVDQVAGLLGITKNAVQKRADKDKLLVVNEGKRKVYPVWQFGEEALVEGFESVLEDLPKSGVGRCRFFLTPLTRLGGMAPIDALNEGRYENVLNEARRFNKHGVR